MLTLFKNRGYQIACAELENSVSVYDCDMKYPILLCIGGEKRGSSKEVKALSDIFLSLEYGREFKEALSAASAAGIIAFEIFRQNRK